MPKTNQSRSIFFLSRTGCLLPFLIFFNLIFGRLFLPPRAGLILEGVLILLYIFNLRLMIHSAGSFYRSEKKSPAIDVEAEVIKDEKDSSKKH